MKIVNLTPHRVNIVKSDNEIISLESEGQVRCAQANKKVGEIDGIPVIQSCYGAVIGLPEPKQDTVYIVSSICAQRIYGRSDVFVVADTVRDTRGKIIGCRSLAQVNE